MPRGKKYKALLKVSQAQNNDTEKDGKVYCGNKILFRSEGHSSWKEMGYASKPRDKIIKASGLMHSETSEVKVDPRE